MATASSLILAALAIVKVGATFAIVKASVTGVADFPGWVAPTTRSQLPTCASSGVPVITPVVASILAQAQVEVPASAQVTGREVSSETNAHV